MPAAKSRKTVAVDVLDGAALAAHRDDRVGPRAGSATVQASSNSMCARARGPGSSVTMFGTVPRRERRAHAGDLLRVAPARRTRERRIQSMQSGYAAECSRTVLPARTGSARSCRAACRTAPRAVRRRGRPGEPAASVDDRVALLAHELGRVVHAQAGLAGRARALPAAERLDARPGAGRRPGPAVHVEDAGLDPVEERARPRPDPRCRRRPSARRRCRWRGGAPRRASRRRGRP